MFHEKGGNSIEAWYLDERHLPEIDLSLPTGQELEDHYRNKFKNIGGVQTKVKGEPRSDAYYTLWALTDENFVERTEEEEDAIWDLTGAGENPNLEAETFRHVLNVVIRDFRFHSGLTEIEHKIARLGSQMQPGQNLDLDKLFEAAWETAGDGYYRQEEMRERIKTLRRFRQNLRESLSTEDVKAHSLALAAEARSHYAYEALPIFMLREIYRNECTDRKQNPIEEFERPLLNLSTLKENPISK